MQTRRSAQTLLLIMVGSVLILLATFLISYNAFQSYSLLRSAALQNASQLARSKAQGIETRLEAIGGDLIFILQSTAFQTYAASADAKAMRVFLSNYLSNHAIQYSGGCLLDANGQEQLCIDNKDGSNQLTPASQLLNQADQDYFKNAITSADISASSPFYLSTVRPADRPFLYAVLPVKNQTTNTIVGVLALKSLLSDITADLPVTGYTPLLLSKGRSLNESNKNLNSLLAQSIQDAPDSGNLITANDLFTYASVRPAKQAAIDWTLVYDQNTGFLTDQLIPLIQNSLLISLIAIIVTGLTAAYLSGRLTQPLNELASTALRISSGDWDLPISQSTGLVSREIDELTKATERMRQGLTTNIRNLRRVAEDTAHLAASPDQSSIARDLVRAVARLTDTHSVRLLARLKDQPVLLSSVPDNLTDSLPDNSRLTNQPFTETLANTTTRTLLPLGQDTGWLEIVTTQPLNEDLRNNISLLCNQAQLSFQKISLYADLITARDDAEGANRAKSAFLATMSHELRTPLNAIIGFADLTVERIEQDDLEDVHDTLPPFTKIARSGRHLLQLINDVLDISKIEAKQAEINASTFNPTEAIQLIVDNTTALRKKEVPVKVNIAADLFTEVFHDRTKFDQIITNLLGNALKFTEKGMIEVNARRRDDSYWLIEIRDSGPGIPENAQSLIFEAFRQVDSSSRRKHGGTGLGLSISRGLAQLMGGSISVHSIIDEGSTFTLTLPAQYTGNVQP